MKTISIAAAAMALSLVAAPAAMAQTKGAVDPAAGPSAGPSFGPVVTPAPADGPEFAGLAALLAVTGLLGVGVIAARKRAAA